jgi:hypothetical protein
MRVPVFPLQIIVALFEGDDGSFGVIPLGSEVVYRELRVRRRTNCVPMISSRVMTTFST